MSLFRLLALDPNLAAEFKRQFAPTPTAFSEERAAEIRAEERECEIRDNYLAKQEARERGGDDER